VVPHPNSKAIPNRADSAVFWWAALTLLGSDDCDPLTERSWTQGGLELLSRWYLLLGEL
jgi:hypothetical protein